MDMHLPKLSGLETMAIVREIKGMLPMILVSADQDESLMRRALSAQAFSVLKPSRSAGVWSSISCVGRSKNSIEAPFDAKDLLRLGRAILWLLRAASSLSPIAHDIPNARVDRSIQVDARGLGKIRVDYEVSLAELTLTQDLRQLIGELPGADRQAWFERVRPGHRPASMPGGFFVAVDGDGGRD